MNGTLTFLNCNAVAIESVSLKCGVGSARAATCTTVRNETNQPCAVNIRNSKFYIGHYQQGILLVNAKRASVENNELSVYKKPNQANFPTMLTDYRFRASVRRSMLYNARLDTPGTDIGNRGIELKAAEQAVFIGTHSALKQGAWTKLLGARQPKRITRSKDLLAHITKLTDRVLMDETFRNTQPAFKQLFDRFALQNQVAVATQGITVGGQIGEDIRILNNTISGFLQGIHVGLSHSSTRDVRDVSETVTISGNTIGIILPAYVSNMGRHGIFVGNCKSLIIENNNILLNRLSDSREVRINGIQVWGYSADG